MSKSVNELTIEERIEALTIFSPEPKAEEDKDEDDHWEERLLQDLADLTSESCSGSDSESGMEDMKQVVLSFLRSIYEISSCDAQEQQPNVELDRSENGEAVYTSTFKNTLALLAIEARMAQIAVGSNADEIVSVYQNAHKNLAGYQCRIIEGNPAQFVRVFPLYEAEIERVYWAILVDDVSMLELPLNGYYTSHHEAFCDVSVEEKKKALLQRLRARYAKLCDVLEYQTPLFLLQRGESGEAVFRFIFESKLALAEVEGHMGGLAAGSTAKDIVDFCRKMGEGTKGYQCWFVDGEPAELVEVFPSYEAEINKEEEEEGTEEEEEGKDEGEEQAGAKTNENEDEDEQEEKACTGSVSINDTSEELSLEYKSRVVALCLRLRYNAACDELGEQEPLVVVRRSDGGEAEYHSIFDHKSTLLTVERHLAGLAASSTSDEIIEFYRKKNEKTKGYECRIIDGEPARLIEVIPAYEAEINAFYEATEAEMERENRDEHGLERVIQSAVHERLVRSLVVIV